MTGEEMERAIAFLLDNQAKHDAAIAANTQAIAELRAEMRDGFAEMRDGFAEMRLGFDALTASMQTMADTMTKLGVMQIDIKHRVERLEGGSVAD